MASKFALVFLACAVAACSAEAPFRGYSSRQQAAPYPAAGYRPERTFNLPTEEAIAQQLRLAQSLKRQRQQQQQEPSRLYGAPESEAQQPSGLYGAPSRPSTQYGAPEEPSASQQRARLVRPKQPSRQYGAPQEAAPQRQLSRQYGPPEPSSTQAPVDSSAESLEESKEVETVAAVANSIDKKPGRLTQGQRDTENDEAETTSPAAAVVQPVYLLPVTGYAPQKLAFLQAAPLGAPLAKLQLPGVYGAQPQKLIAAPQLLAPQKLVAAPQLLAPQGYYQPQQLALASPLQAW